MSSARVALADDDVLLREGLASLLERSGFAIVDIRMPPTHTTEGLDAARAIREEFPDIGILVLSAYVDVEHAMELLATGQRIGYLLKSRVTAVDEFIETVELMAEGRSNTGIAHRLWVTEGTVEKHVRSILMKLNLPEGEDDNRRVLAVVTYLESR